MEYKEFFEQGIEPTLIRVEFVEKEDYETIHKNVIIACHDVFITCSYSGEQGILLVQRLLEPAQGAYWPIGGRMLRGVPAEESLQKRTLDECSLVLTNIKCIGTGRTLFKEDPFGHGKGTDTFNLVYTADGEGELKLNDVHTAPKLITKENYAGIRATLHPYVQTHLDTILS